MKALALPVIILLVVAVNAGVGYLAGLGGAIVLEALTGLFCLLAAFGGPLRSDLRLLAVFAPVLVLGAGVPRLLGAVSPWPAIALLAVAIFVAGLLPVLGQRYVTVGLGLGMASVRLRLPVDRVGQRGAGARCPGAGGRGGAGDPAAARHP